MNPLVATNTSRIPVSGAFPGKIAAAVLAAMLGLVSGAFAAGVGEVTLEWNANPEANIAGYRLQYGTVSGVYPNSMDAGNATTATASGLNQGTAYYFTVVAYNTAGQTSPASSQISYTVPGTPNTAPSAATFGITVGEDGQGAATLSGTDGEGDLLSYTVVSGPAKGTLSGSGPNLTYRPAANLNGNDSFTYRSNDGVLNSPVATVSITITPVNDAPVATARSAATTEDNPVAVVLSATDLDGDSLAYSIVTAPTKGTLVGTPPNLTFQPAANVSGGDSFTFRVYDGAVYSAAATVSLGITAVNDAPVATAKSVTVTEDTAIGVTLAGTDTEGNPLTYTVLAQPTKGTLSGSVPNLTYTPGLNATGSDSFSFRVNDGTANSAAATVSLSISAVNDAPLAAAKSVSTPRNTAVGIVLTGTDVEGGALTYTVLTSPTKGTLSGSAPNLTYTPNTDSSGSDSFTYRVNDGAANSAAATVGITVTNGNRAPQASSKSLATLKNKEVSVELSASDADANPLTYRVVSQPATGALTGTPPNLAFKPETGFVGNASFTYVANDGIVDSAVATVTVKVKASNAKPVATAKTMVVNRNTATALLLAGTDADSDALTFSVVKPPLNGTLTGTPPNLSYLPNTGFRGTDSFTFLANDGVVNSAAAAVSITVVNPNNRAPTSAAWSVSTPLKTAVPVTLRATDADGDPLVYRIVGKPAGGRLTGKVPNLVFKPKAKFVGAVSFAYVANDGAVDSAPITVIINVTQPPVVAARGLVKAKTTAGAETLPEMSLTSDPARPGGIRLRITGTPGESYTLEHSIDLATWAVDREIVIGEGGGLHLEVAAPAGTRRGFYRLSTP